MKQKYWEQYTLLNKMDNRIDDLYHQIAVRTGISDSVFWALYSLYEPDRIHTQLSIAEDMGYPKQTINSAINKLLEMGYLMLKKMSGERNTKQILLTEEGKAFCDRHIAPIYEAEERAMDCLTEQEIETYIALSKKQNQLLQKELAAFLGSVWNAGNEPDPAGV